MKTVFIFTALLLAGTARADEKDLQRLAALVDYVAADYAGAVQGGQVVSATEYEEQKGLVDDARALATRVRPEPGAAGAPAELAAAVAGLVDAVAAKAPEATVVAHSRAVRTILVDAYGLVLAPTAPPSLARARALYPSACAPCHGLDGHAGTPQGRALKPPPPSFFDAERMARISPALAYHALSFGIKDSPMPAFDTLPSQDRWNLAFYVLALRHAHGDLATGARAAKTADVPASPGALAALSDADLDEHLRAQIPDDQQRAAAIDWLRAEAPFAAVVASDFSDARRRLAELGAHADSPLAHDLAVAAYLDGVEPHEAQLRARDPALTTRIEASFLALRKIVDEHEGRAALERQIAQTDVLLDRADDVLRARAGRSVAFVASMTIALREGLEAALLIAALLAFLRKAGRERDARLVHLGWLVAIPAGLVTWWLAGELLGGARRELVEAVVTLTAAAMILAITHWVLGRIESRHWLGYLRRGMTSAASGWALFGLAFFAAYREACEIVLFYRALLLDAANARTAVVLGAVAGVGGIAVVLLAFKYVGKRLDPRPVMLASSVLLAALAIALVGRGVRALEEGGYVGTTPLPLPDLSVVGLYPTLQGLAAQLVVGLALVVPSLVERRRRRAASEDAVEATPANPSQS